MAMTDRMLRMVDSLNIRFMNERPSIGALWDFLKKYQSIDPTAVFSDEEQNEIILKYIEINGIKTPSASVLVGHNDDWFESFEQSRPEYEFWERYRSRYLIEVKHFSAAAIETVKADLKRTIRHFADPKSSDVCHRKGLVVGDVQSGKTANYIGLINMAVDAGYKKIILLSGMTEDLRIQTQKRCDAGFLFAPSDRKEATENVNSGDRYAASFTDTKHDFDSVKEHGVYYRLSELNLPIVSVIKKNKHILDNLSSYISDNRDRENVPLLIIDDECDNASINTNDPEVNPTTINKKIRELIESYRVVTYVGYSATPYANIFIDPDATIADIEHPEQCLSNLFPDDFIVLLEPPSNYFGANTLFKGFNEETDEAMSSCHIIKLDEERIFPAKHKKDTPFVRLDPELEEAIYVFLISSAIYSLRGFENKHRTMMINISTYNDVQKSIKERVTSLIDDIYDEYESYGALPLKRYLERPVLNRFFRVWSESKYFCKDRLFESDEMMRSAKDEFDFDLVRKRIWEELKMLQIRIINGRVKREEKFNYDDYKDVGARLIAIGGFGLSRGLTLEGLITSYYNRNASAFDILLQMGRWFGYRDHYDDLVTIFMTYKNIQSFCAATESNNNLKKQFRTMAAQGKTPRDFGLMVLIAPDTIEHTIMVTSRNKSRSAEKKIISIDVEGHSMDNSKISKNPADNLHNRDAVVKFINSAFDNGAEIVPSATMDKHQYIKNVPYTLVTDFIERLEISDSNLIFDKKNINKLITSNPVFQCAWNVVIGNGLLDDKLDLKAGRFLHLVPRRFENKLDVFAIAGSNNRILNPGVLKIDLSEQEFIELQEKNGKNKAYSDDVYLSVPNRHPVLIVFPIDLKIEDSSESDIRDKNALDGIPLFGFAVCLPGDGEKHYVECLINKVKAAEYENEYIADELVEEE